MATQRPTKISKPLLHKLHSLFRLAGLPAKQETHGDNDNDQPPRNMVGPQIPQADHGDAMTTLRDRYALGLSACGYQRQQTTSKKYWFYHRDSYPEYYVWLGKAGAVRISTASAISTSRAMSDAGKAKLLALADTAKGEAA